MFGDTIMIGNSELETVFRNKFKHSRYYASSVNLKVLKEAEETMFFRCSMTDNSIVSDEI